MSTMTANEKSKAAELPEDVRDGVRDLILVLADSKRLLGMRYGNWMLGAPELEAGIACASMAQDEWGHARLLYALLRDFAEDVDRLEHGREPAEYRNMEVLDEEPASWPELVALNALVDAALTTQLAALTQSSYVPLRQRVHKLIEEESFHAAHGAAWFRRLASAGEAGRAEVRAAVERVLAPTLRWFGPDSESARALQHAGIASATGSALREHFVRAVAPLLEQGGVDAAVVSPDFAGFDESRRRVAGTSPDERVIAQVRGDLNRAFLMD